MSHDVFTGDNIMLAVFDIDGTLANNDHREHLAQAKKWDEFHKLAPGDKPLEATAAVARALHEAGHRIAIWTARPDTYWSETRDWLNKHNIPWNDLRMRVEGDWRRAYILKLEWFLTSEVKPDIVFEDHPETTRLLRAAGCTVHQVAERENIQS